MANISHFTQTVNGVSTTYDIHDANAIPRSGGAVLEGQRFMRTVDNSSLNLYGGTGFSNGAFLQLAGKDNADAGQFLIRANDGSTSAVLIGKADGTLMWKNKNVAMQEDVVPVPTGSYIQFAGSQAPAGFLVCNGGEISRTTYSKLFAVIGTTYGSGDGSTTFNLPNLTDRFLQGSTTSGTVKDAGLPNITGSVVRVLRGGYGSTGALVDGSPAGEAVQGGGSGVDSTLITFDASKSNSIYGNSTTVQPPALTCLICIKY